MRIAICDDNKTDLIYIEKSINSALKKININAETDTFTDSDLLLKQNRSNPYDAIFLDIDMPKANGMDIAAQLNKVNSLTEIIFVTNHDELVYKAYRFKALGFIRKEFLETEINEMLDILIENLNSNQKYIIVNDSGTSKKIPVNDILYMQSDDHYVDVYLTDKHKKETIRESLNNIEKDYSQHGFIRTHIRYLVNYKYIYSIEKNVVILTNHQQLPLSRSKTASVKEAFQFFSRRL